MSYNFTSQKNGSWSDYTVWHAIHAIASVVAGSKTFTIAANVVAEIIAGSKIVITGSTGNNGTYTVVSCIFTTVSTIIVVETVPNATADGVITSTTLPTNTGYATAVAIVNHAILVDIVVAPNDTLQMTINGTGVGGALTFIDAVTDYLQNVTTIQLNGSGTNPAISGTVLLNNQLIISAISGKTWKIVNTVLGGATAITFTGASKSTLTLDGVTVNTSSNWQLTNATILGGTLLGGLTILALNEVDFHGSGAATPTLGGNILFTGSACTISFGGDAQYQIGTVGGTIIFNSIAQSWSLGQPVDLQGTFKVAVALEIDDDLAAGDGDNPHFILTAPGATVEYGIDPQINIGYSGPGGTVYVNRMGLS